MLHEEAPSDLFDAESVSGDAGARERSPPSPVGPGQIATNPHARMQRRDSPRCGRTGGELSCRVRT
jgi:hypothetical protein